LNFGLKSKFAEIMASFAPKSGLSIGKQNYLVIYCKKNIRNVENW
jgi:hypothetical protein